tara:strand:+ start:8386 stop:8736 length:351 start_codon:yes stop_codon:yes gene_type:complete
MIKNYFKKKLILLLILLSFILNIILWMILVFAIKRGGEFALILHYNVLYGADIFGQHHELYSLPISGLVILGVNSILGFFSFKQKQFLLNYILLGTAVLAQVFLLISGIALVIINK